MADRPKKTSSSGAAENRKARQELLIWLTVIVLLAAAAALTVILGVSAIYPHWFEKNPRMILRRIRISSSDQSGIQNYWSTRRGRRKLLKRLELELGVPLAELDTGKVRAELEDPKRFSSVQSARVVRVLPDTLSIELTERIPLAFLDSRDSKVVVDDACMLIKRSESMAAVGKWDELPLITGLDRRTDVGERDPRLSPAVALILETQKNRDPRTAIKIIKIEFESLDPAGAGRAEPNNMLCTFRFGRPSAEDEHVYRALFPLRDLEKYLDVYLYRLVTSVVKMRQEGRSDWRFFDLTFDDMVVIRPSRRKSK